MTIDFVIPGEPIRATAQQKGERVVNGRVLHYTKSKVKAAREMYKYATLLALPHGFQPFDKKTPVSLFVAFNFGTDVKKQVLKAKTTRPDLDNMEKALIDGLTDAGIWADDSQIADKHTTKHWVSREHACTHIRIETMEEDI